MAPPVTTSQQQAAQQPTSISQIHSQNQNSSGIPRRVPQPSFPIRLPPSSASFLRPLQMPSFTITSSVSPNYNSINPALLSSRDNSESSVPTRPTNSVSSSQAVSAQTQTLHTEGQSNQPSSSNLPYQNLIDQRNRLRTRLSEAATAEAISTSTSQNTRSHIQSVTQAFMHLRQYFADNYRQNHQRNRRRLRNGQSDDNIEGTVSSEWQDEMQLNSDSDDCDDSPPPQRRLSQRLNLGDPLMTANDFPSAHSHFRYKIVCNLNCRYCSKLLCSRGMKAILLADTKVELYSTDTPPAGVALVNDDYVTDNCRCRIHDVACLGCGNVVGYHVTQPCETCLDSCNNGHFWMFQMEGVAASERTDATGTKPLLWAFLPAAEKDTSNFLSAIYSLCR